MNEPQSRSVWGSGGAYEPYVGGWSRLIAREFLTWLALPPSAQWLDVGCGTGALSETILTQAAPTVVHGIDPSESYLALAREQVRDPRVRFELGDARQLPGATAAYDAVVSGLVLNFISRGPAGRLPPMSGIMRTKWNSCDTSGMRQSRSDQRRVNRTKAGAFRSVNLIPCGIFLARQGCRRWKSVLLVA